VITTEIDQIVAEMGPVDGAARESGEPAGDSAGAGNTADEAQDVPPRRLYRIPDGAMIAGVCNGLAVYFQVDVTIVRVAFAAAALFTSGVGIIAYVIMMFVVPEAKTPEERAAAGGAPFNAKEVIDRAKKVAEGSRHWRQQRRKWRRHGWPPGVPIAYGPPPPWAVVLLPVFGLVHVALFLIMAAMMVSLVNTGGLLSWRLPPDVPVWAGALILLIAYQIVVSPIRAVQHWTSHPHAVEGPAWFAFWNAVVWLIGLAFLVWIASNHVPEIRQFLQRVPELIREFTHAIRDLVSRLR